MNVFNDIVNLFETSLPTDEVILTSQVFSMNMFVPAFLAYKRCFIDRIKSLVNFGCL